MAVLKLKNFAELLEKLKSDSENNFISDEFGKLSFSELAFRVENNIEKYFPFTGKRFFIKAEHHISFIEFFLSVIVSGNIAIPVNSEFSDEKIQSLKSKFGIISYLKSVEDLKQFEIDSKIIYPLNNNDPALALFTSGSTGEAKAVLMSHENIFFNAYSVIESMELSNPENILIMLPLYHSFALITQLITTLITGGKIFFTHELKFFGGLIEFINNNQIKTLAGVPTNFKLLLMGNEINFPYVKHITVAGASLDLKLANDIKRSFNNADLWVGYGLTEAGPRVTAIKDSDPKFKIGSVGKAISGVNIYLDNQELLIESPSVMLGYLDDEKATAEKLIDGKLYTSDIGRIDTEGYLYITGRKDDIFLSAGEKISPQLIESVLNKHPDIQLSAVFPEEDKLFGNKIIALIKTDKVLKTKELIAFCAKYLESYLIPHKFFKTEQFPLTSNGKIKRKELPLCQKEKL